MELRLAHEAAFETPEQAYARGHMDGQDSARDSRPAATEHPPRWLWRSAVALIAVLTLVAGAATWVAVTLAARPTINQVVELHEGPGGGVSIEQRVGEP